MNDRWERGAARIAEMSAAWPDIRQAAYDTLAQIAPDSAGRGGGPQFGQRVDEVARGSASRGEGCQRHLGRGILSIKN